MAQQQPTQPRQEPHREPPPEPRYEPRFEAFAAIAAVIAALWIRNHASGWERIMDALHVVNRQAYSDLGALLCWLVAILAGVKLFVIRTARHGRRRRDPGTRNRRSDARDIDRR